jgi:hypothetical protein
MELKQSNVRLDRDTHRYYLGTKELSGITRRIGDRLGFAPSQFADPTLGIEVHEEIELMSFGIPPKTEHGKRFAEWVDGNGIHIIANEYIVTDGERYASPIDFITEEDTDVVDFWDTKTFRKFTRDSYVRAVYQMNIYAYLFKLMNGFRPRRLMILQVSEEACKEIQLPFISEEEVKDLLYSEGEFKSSLIKTNCEKPELSQLYDLQTAINELDARKKYLEGVRDRIKTELAKEMAKEGTMSMETERIRVTYKDGYERRSVDVDSLKAYNVKLYDELCKKSNVPASVTITLK